MIVIAQLRVLSLFLFPVAAAFISRDDKLLDHLIEHRDADGFCGGEMLMNPDNYYRCLLHFVSRFDAAVAAGRYDYLDAVRKNVACARRELLGRRDVLPAVRRLVYDTTNLYLQRVGLAVYGHETADQREKSASAAVATGFPVARLHFVAACVTTKIVCRFN